MDDTTLGLWVALGMLGSATALTWWAYRQGTDQRKRATWVALWQLTVSPLRALADEWRREVTARKQVRTIRDQAQRER